MRGYRSKAKGRGEGRRVSSHCAKQPCRHRLTPRHGAAPSLGPLARAGATRPGCLRPPLTTLGGTDWGMFTVAAFGKVVRWRRALETVRVVVLCCAVLCCVVLCCAVWCCFVPCCAVLCHVVMCRVVSCRDVSCRVVSRRVASRRVVSLRVVSRRVASRRVASRRVVLVCVV